jgi:hypothetical protein
MTNKQLKKIKALLQAFKNRPGYAELSKNESKEKFLFTKVNKNKYRIRMIKQERK